MSSSKIAAFSETVLNYYRASGRYNLPWRVPEQDGQFDPYKILVSELMLQQTQVSRVVPKFHQFLEQFPNTYALAHAALAEVLAVWNGLGYNRRARFLWQAAQKIEAEFGGSFPTTKEALVSLPGVGTNTAGAILVYAFNEPTVFIETNIRSVFIHHFFKDQNGVDDKAIAELVAQSLPKENPREWYWALMDYGVHLKQTIGNSARASKSYVRQSKFHGSRRQIRGRVIKLLLEGPRPITQLTEEIQDDRVESILDELVNEQLIRKTGNTYAIFDA